MQPETRLSSVDVAVVILALVLWLGFLPVWLRRQEWGKKDQGTLKSWAVVVIITTTIAMLLMTKAFFRQ